MNKYDILDYIAYIVSSAKCCIKEPKIYGSFRLVDSIEKLIILLEKHNIVIDDDIKKIIEKIQNEKLSFMTDEEHFILMLDEVTSDLIETINENSQ